MPRSIPAEEFMGYSTKSDSQHTATSPRARSPMKESIYGITRQQFRNHGRATIDYLADYFATIKERRVVAKVKPGYLRELLPSEAPMEAEPFEKCLADFEKLVMPGVTHWQHPRFHAYFSNAASFPALLGTIVGDAMGAVGFSWAACPAITELDNVCLQWYGKMMDLPEEFLPYTPNSKGGGVIQAGASECVFVSVMAARFNVIKKLKLRFPDIEEGWFLSKLVAYMSNEAHSSVEKACKMSMVKYRKIGTDEKYRMRGDALRDAILSDREKGLIPFYVCATLGTTSCVSFDNLEEIGPIAREFRMWMHIDAAYGGSSFICPENRHLMKGIHYATSIASNPNKLMLTNYDCSAMWVRDRYKLMAALDVDPTYLKNHHSLDDKSIDFRHWGIPLSRRFRSVKFWWVMRMYGVEGLRGYIRNLCKLAKRMESLIRANDVFEVLGEVHLGLVCFRIKNDNESTKILLRKLNDSGKIHMVPTWLNEKYAIRFATATESLTEKDIEISYDMIWKMTQLVLTAQKKEPSKESIRREPKPTREEVDKQLEAIMQLSELNLPSSLAKNSFNDPTPSTFPRKNSYRDIVRGIREQQKADAEREKEAEKKAVKSQSKMKQLGSDLNLSSAATSRIHDEAMGMNEGDVKIVKHLASGGRLEILNHKSGERKYALKCRSGDRIYLQKNAEHCVLQLADRNGMKRSIAFEYPS